PPAPPPLPPVASNPPSLLELVPRTSRVELHRALHEGTPEDRQQHAVSLGELGRRVHEGVPELASALHDEDSAVRAGAAEALGKLGPAARGTYVPLLNSARMDPVPRVRQAAQVASERIGPPTSADVPLLAHGLKDPDAAYRAACAQALLMVGDEAG